MLLARIGVRIMTQLTDEQQLAVKSHQGCVPVEGPEGKYVLMRMELYREMLGIGSEDELEDSLQSIRRGWDDLQAGRTRPFREFLDEIGRKYETSR